MRPIERGPIPNDNNGRPKVYANYVNARRDLIDRMGQYCAYCNQKLPASLAVEHVQPKVLIPNLRLEWTNFLLGCTNCNSTKKNKPVLISDFIWPDIHNSHLAFKYNPDGTVEVSPSLDNSLKQKAQNMLDLVGLQKYPNTPADSDRRWKNRLDTFLRANEALKLYISASAKGAEAEFTEVLAQWAADCGFFSIWIVVFDAYPNIKRAIATAFKGTAMSAFDQNMNPVKRATEL